MKWLAATLTLSALVLYSSGCGDLTHESKAWRDQVQQTVIALQESMDALALSVPGERWSRQMEALTDPDPQKRQKALDEIATGVAASLGKPQTVRAVIGSLDAGSIRARFFLAPTNQIAELESFCAQGAFVSLDVWKNSLTRPKTSEEIKAAVRKQATEFLDTVLGVPKYSITGAGEFGGTKSVTWKPTSLGTPADTVLRGYTEADIAKRRERAIEVLADLMALHYGEIAISNRGDTLEHDWNSTQGFGVLHVVVPADDLKRLDRIDTWIHEKGKPDSRWDGMTSRVLKPESFRALPKAIVERCLPGDDDLYWAAADLAKSVYHSAPSSKVVHQLAKLRAAVNELKQIYEAESSR